MTRPNFIQRSTCLELAVPYECESVGTKAPEYFTSTNHSHENERGRAVSYTTLHAPFIRKLATQTLPQQNNKSTFSYLRSTLSSIAHRQGSHGSHGCNEIKSGAKNVAIHERSKIKSYITLFFTSSQNSYYFVSDKASNAAMASAKLKRT